MGQEMLRAGGCVGCRCGCEAPRCPDSLWGCGLPSDLGPGMGAPLCAKLRAFASLAPVLGLATHQCWQYFQGEKKK